MSELNQEANGREAETESRRFEGFANIPVAALKESPNNPRKSFDKKALEELERNVRGQGVLVPLLVRPIAVRRLAAEKALAIENGSLSESAKETMKEATGVPVFEILAGARRFRCAVKIGLAEVPCRVMTGLTDAQALEIMVIENLQRQDVHPLEEAEGFAALMKAGEYDAAALARKIGKSVGYVYARLKLGDIIAPVKKALRAEEISTEHAVLIARLDEAVQAEALDNCVSESWNVRELREWIREEFHCELETAPWDKADATLVAAAGACTTCPKRASANPSDDDASENLCADRECFKGKLAAYLNRRRFEIAAPDGLPPLDISRRWTNEKEILAFDRYHRIDGADDACDFARTGLVVAGEPNEIGQSFEICADKKCKKHHGESDFKRGEYRGESKADKAKREIEQTNKKAAKVARVATVRAILAKVEWPFPRKVLEIVAQECSHALQRVVKEKEIGKASDAELARLMVESVCGDYDQVWYYEKDGEIPALAKIYKVEPTKPEAEKLERKKSKSKPKKTAKLKASKSKKTARKAVVS